MPTDPHACRARFSRRTDWSRAENAFTRALREARARSGFIDLTISNPTRAGLGYPEEAIRRALDAAPVDYEAAPLGLSSAREAVAAYYARRGIEVSPERIALVASTSEAYGFLFRLLCDPQDAVLIPRPSYPLFDFLCQLSDVEPRPYRLSYDGAWHLDGSALEGAGGARAILVVSPNNPTGTIHGEDERRAIAGAGLPIVSDEVFADFLHPPRDHRAASWIDSRAERLTFSLGGLSKAAGLPQLKLGWIVASGPAGEVDEALARLEIVGDTFLSVAGPVQHALGAILDAAEGWQAGLRARIAENCAAAAELTRGTACSVRPSHGGWYAVIDLPRTETDERWAITLAAEEGVAVHPGYLFDIEEGATVVASTIVPPDRFREGLARLVARIC